jgi:hypothetical protein
VNNADGGLALGTEEIRSRIICRGALLYEVLAVLNRLSRCEPEFEVGFMNAAVCAYACGNRRPQGIQAHLEACQSHGVFDGLQMGAGRDHSRIFVVENLVVGPLLATFHQRGVFLSGGIGGEFRGRALKFQWMAKPRPSTMTKADMTANSAVNNRRIFGL